MDMVILWVSGEGVVFTKMPNFIKFFFFARSRWRNSNLPASSHTCSDERQHCKVQVFTPAHRVKEGTASVQVLFLASQTAGAAAQWDAVASRETFKIAWPLDEHRMKKYERGTVQRPDHTSRANNSHTPIQDVVGVDAQRTPCRCTLVGGLALCGLGRSREEYRVRSPRQKNRVPGRPSHQGTYDGSLKQEEHVVPRPLRHR